MDRVFLDANVLFSAAYRPDSGLRRLWKIPTAKLITSAYAIEETRRNLDPEKHADLDGPYFDKTIEGVLVLTPAEYLRDKK